MSGIYIGAMGMMANTLRIDVHSQNIANSQTYGYKTDKATFRVFEETTQHKFYKDEAVTLGKYNDLVYVDNIHTNYKTGNFVQTKHNLDFALSDTNREQSGVSFFVIEKNGEQLLTRNGAFKLNADRILTTNLGGVVLDENNQSIQIPENTAISVSKDGVIQNAQSGEAIAQLKIRSVAKQHLNMLEKLPEQSFKVMTVDKIEQEFGPIENWIDDFDRNITLQKIFGSREHVETMMNTGENNILGMFTGELNQNMLESSNVDMTDEMVGLMEAQKSLQASQKVLTVMDKILEKDANEIAR